MKTITNIVICGFLAASAAFAQLNTIIQTSLSAAVTAQQTVFPVASATGIVAPSTTVAGSALYIVDVGQTKGELASVTGISSTNISVRRTGGGQAKAHASGAMVLIATAPNWFQQVDPSGSCVTAATYVTPYVNVSTGYQWLCSTVTLTWVPGWNNPGAPAVTTLVASAASAVTPSGPFFHINGTSAITGFNIPVGFNAGRFCAVADTIWTWTAAGNILTAGTTTAAGRLHCFQWDSNAVKWVPDKII